VKHLMKMLEADIKVDFMDTGYGSGRRMKLDQDHV
jgi:hypothetical protein